MPVRRQKIHILHCQRKRPQGLDPVQAEENAALAQVLADCLVINPVATYEMARRQRHQPRVLIHLSHHVGGADGPQPARVHQPHFHPLPHQGHPGIDIGRIIFEVDEDVVAFPELHAAGNNAQPQGCRADERNFVRLAIEQPRPKFSSLLQNRRVNKLFLVPGGGGPGVIRDRFRNPPGQRANARMRQKHFVPCDRELTLPQIFVSKQFSNGHGSYLKRCSRECKGAKMLKADEVATDGKREFSH